MPHRPGSPQSKRSACRRPPCVFRDVSSMPTPLRATLAGASSHVGTSVRQLLQADPVRREEHAMSSGLRAAEGTHSPAGGAGLRGHLAAVFEHTLPWQGVC